MSTHSITLQLPISLFEQIQDRAQRARQTMESEVLDLVTTAVEDDRLPDDMAAAVESLDLLDDTALWRAAGSTLAPKQQERLEALNFKQQSEGLTHSERDIHATLLQAYDRAVLVRARAAEILVERGHDVSELLRSR
jgi:hypothetical protein